MPVFHSKIPSVVKETLECHPHEPSFEKSRPERPLKDALSGEGGPCHGDSAGGSALLSGSGNGRLTVGLGRGEEFFPLVCSQDGGIWISSGGVGRSTHGRAEVTCCRSGRSP